MYLLGVLYIRYFPPPPGGDNAEEDCFLDSGHCLSLPRHRGRLRDLRFADGDGLPQGNELDRHVHGHDGVHVRPGGGRCPLASMPCGLLVRLHARRHLPALHHGSAPLQVLSCLCVDHAGAHLVPCPGVPSRPRHAVPRAMTAHIEFVALLPGYQLVLV